MSTKIDRASGATPAVPTTPAEPVKPAEAPRAPGKADVETGIVQDIMERGESLMDAGRALFGGVGKAVQEAGKEVTGGAGMVKKSVAELQADAARAVGQGLKPLSSPKVGGVVLDMIKRGVDEVVKEEFKGLNPLIVDPKKVADQLERAGKRVDEGLKGVSDELRSRAAQVMLDIKNNAAPYLTVDDLKLPFTEPRRVLAEMVQIGEELGESARDGVVDGVTEVGLGAAKVVADYGAGVRDAAEVAERYMSGRFLTDGTALEGLRPFALLFLPMVKLLDGVQLGVNTAEQITKQADNIRAFTDALTPSTTQASILALKENETLNMSLGGEVALGIGPELGAGGKVELKVTRQPGEPAVFIAEVSQEAALGGGFDVGVAEGSLAKSGIQKITVELRGERAAKDFVSVLYGHGLGVIDDPSKMNQIAEKITREETTGAALGLEGGLSGLDAEMKRDFGMTSGVVTDKSGQPTASLYKLSTKLEMSAGVDAGGGALKIRLPQVPGERGEALRQAYVEQLKGRPDAGLLVKNIPDAALDRMIEINGLRTDITLKVQHQVDLQLELPANAKDVGKATQLTLTNTIISELGDSAMEAKLDVVVKNPAALFELFRELSPEQLVAKLGDGAITHEDMEARAAASGFKLSDILTVKLSSTEKTTRAGGVEVDVADKGVFKSEQGVTKSTLIGEKVFIGTDKAAKPDAERHKAPIGRNIHELVGIFKP